MLHVLAATRLIFVRFDDSSRRDVIRRQDADKATLSVLVGFGEHSVQGCLIHHPQGGLLAVCLPSGNDAIGYAELLCELHEAHAYRFTQRPDFTSGPFGYEWHGSIS
ncbi:hypothetical protein AB0H92_06805 [Streptomyces phaeochromogenes]|uniref:hypothetical protein n=1 Tax=Streptomyces phaeochromogenes TaxID=1923 RepID=UPI0033DDC46E